MRGGALVGDERVDRRPFANAFELAGLVVQPFDGRQLLLASQLGLAHGRLQHGDSLVVDAQRDREGVAVLAAVREGEASGVAEAAGRAVHHLGDHGQRAHGALAHAGHEQQRAEVRRPAIGGGGERAVQPAEHDVGRPDIVVRGHAQVRQQRLRRRLGGAQGGELAGDAVGPQRGEQVHLAAAGRLRAMVGEIDDLSLTRPVDGRVRLVHEALESLRQPVIAARLVQLFVHALLHHHPLAVVGDDEAMQVELEAVLHGSAVDLGDQAAGRGQRGAVEADALADRDQLVRGLARVPAAAAADMQAQVLLEGRQASLQGADHARGDAGGVPVHAHDGAEGLEPEGMGEAAKQLVAAVVMHDGLADHGSEARHAIGQPRRHPPAMQRQIGASRASSHRSNALSSCAAADT
jgi:hypothetical protein